MTENGDGHVLEVLLSSQADIGAPSALPYVVDFLIGLVDVDFLIGLVNDSCSHN